MSGFSPRHVWPFATGALLQPKQTAVANVFGGIGRKVMLRPCALLKPVAIREPDIFPGR
ncbi:MAG: hypothetical protein V4712_11000 [Pseudomonadota bacterium]